MVEEVGIYVLKSIKQGKGREKGMKEDEEGKKVGKEGKGGERWKGRRGEGRGGNRERRKEVKYSLGISGKLSTTIIIKKTNTKMEGCQIF